MHPSEPDVRPPRLSAQVFLDDLMDALFSLDRGLPWTLWQLLRRPGWVARRYVDWRDPRLVRPFRLVLALFAATALILHLNGDLADFRAGFAEGMAADAGTRDGPARGALVVLGRFDLVLLLCWVPACALAFRSSHASLQPNLAEAVVFALFALAHGLLLLLPAVLLLGLVPQALWSGGRGPDAMLWLAVLLLVPLIALLRAAHGYARPEGVGVGRALACALQASVLAGLLLVAVLLVAMGLGAMLG